MRTLKLLAVMVFSFFVSANASVAIRGHECCTEQAYAVERVCRESR